MTKEQLRLKINRNMGCIEIRGYFTEHKSGTRLIETWDVLKFAKGNGILKFAHMINRNMGCIEIIPTPLFLRSIKD